MSLAYYVYIFCSEVCVTSQVLYTKQYACRSPIGGDNWDSKND